MREQKYQAAGLLDASAPVGALAAMPGLKFEEIVSHLLTKDLEVRVRDLRTKAEFTLKIKKAGRVVWSGIDDLKLHGRDPKHLAIAPTDHVAGGPDLLFWDQSAGHHWPVDATQAHLREPSIHADELAAMVSALGWTAEHGWPTATATAGGAGETSSLQSSSTSVPAAAAGQSQQHMQVKYFWAVPEERFHYLEWGSQRPRKEGSNTTALADEVWAHVSQFAICMPRSLMLARFVEVLKKHKVEHPEVMVGDRYA